MKRTLIVFAFIFFAWFVIGGGASNFSRLVLGDGNFGADPNSSADITFQNDEYLSNATDGVLDAGTGKFQAATLNYYGTSDNVVGTDSLLITASPAITAYTTGMLFVFKPDTANTGACYVDVNGLGGKAVKTASGADPANSDLVTTTMALMVYNGTNMILINPATTTD